MTTNIYVVHAEWCPHCVSLLETLKTIGGPPSKNGEYNVNGTTVSAIEEKELNNEDTKKILGNRPITGFPTILVKNKSEFVEYDGPRDSASLLNLVSKHKSQGKKMRHSVTGGRRIKGSRKRSRKMLRKGSRKGSRKGLIKRSRKGSRKTAKKTVSWLF
jgi:glutaredoxin